MDWWPVQGEPGWLQPSQNFTKDHAAAHEKMKQKRRMNKSFVLKSVLFGMKGFSKVLQLSGLLTTETLMNFSLHEVTVHNHQKSRLGKSLKWNKWSSGSVSTPKWGNELMSSWTLWSNALQRWIWETNHTKLMQNLIVKLKLMRNGKNKNKPRETMILSFCSELTERNYFFLFSLAVGDIRLWPLQQNHTVHIECFSLVWKLWNIEHYFPPLDPWLIMKGKTSFFCQWIVSTGAW